MICRLSCIHTIEEPRLRSVTAVTGRALSIWSMRATQRLSTPFTGARKAIRVPSGLMRTTLRSGFPKMTRRGSSPEPSSPVHSLVSEAAEGLIGSDLIDRYSLGFSSLTGPHSVPARDGLRSLTRPRFLYRLRGFGDDW